MASPAITRDDVAGWLASRPGLFESPTSRGVWGRAWRKFSKRGQYDRDFRIFVNHVRANGWNVRRIGCGLFILDRVQ